MSDSKRGGEARKAPASGPGASLPRFPQAAPPPASPLEPGDFLPDFQLHNHRGGLTGLFAKLKGRAILLAFFPSAGLPACQQRLRSLAARAEAWAREAQLFLISRDSPAENARLAGLPGLAELMGGEAGFLLSDPRGDAARAYGVEHNRQDSADFTGQGAFTLLLADENRRILALERDIRDEGALERLLAILAARPKPEGRVIARPAPLLAIPRVLDPGLCRRLIAVYESDNVASGTQVDRPDGSAGEKLDPAFKIRRDHTVKDPALNAEIRDLMARRVLPEVAKAFFYKIAGYEVFKIACYDADGGGYFRTHRDNTAASSAHRRFAMTLNLNAGEYEGGELNFPEYGPDLYSPGTGDAVIFSCSLLHEARPVTKGRRFVLLAFFYGPEGQQILKARAPVRRG